MDEFADKAPVVFFGKEIADVYRPVATRESEPLLSICVPTYNRAAKLRSLLHSIVVQCAGLEQEVEIVVSNNASPDDTGGMVRRCSETYPIVYSRNRTNEGPLRNIQILASTLAKGKFTWLIGDDDLVLPGGVRLVLEVLRKNPEVHFVFANTLPRGADEYTAKMRDGIVHGEDFPTDGPRKGKYLGDRKLAAFDELIDPNVDEVFLGALMCGVSRTSAWRAYPREFPSLSDSWGGSFHTLEGSYPHAIVYAQAMVGKPAYYLGTPVSIAFWGAQEWLSGVPRLVLLRLQELLDLYERNGVAAKRIARCRAGLVENSRAALATMVMDSATPGFEEFSVNKYIRDNRVVAHEVFDQLDAILGMARARKTSNRLVDEAEALVKAYPRIRLPQGVDGGVNPQASSAFQQAMARFQALLNQGKLSEALSYLHMAKKAAPDASSAAMVEQVFKMLAEKGLYGKPGATPATGQVRPSR